MMRYSIVFVLGAAGVMPLTAQRLTAPQFAAASTGASVRPMAPSHDTFRSTLVHYGKWLTAAGTVALTVLAAQENQQSQREWNALLTICRSSRDACLVGPNGTYVRGDAEALYQLSRKHDRKANQWLFAAQAALFTTTAIATIATMMALQVIDFEYSKIIRVAFPDSAQLTAFLGVFDGLTNVVALMLQLFAVPWCLRRFGVRTGDKPVSDL